MKCIMLMYDSLNRHFLNCYTDRNSWVKSPNFDRLGAKTCQFEKAYCGSMPCMPARRELHTGRPNFLETTWGAIQPYDDSMVEILRDSGVHTHLVSDHYHYWEEHACNYHARYNTWEFFRGQEGDPWIGQIAAPNIPENINGKGRDQDWINRPYMAAADEMPGVQTVSAGLAYIDMNKDADQYFLQIECFDPHEPFFFDEQYKAYYEEHYKNYDGPLFDWPGYCVVGDETPEQIEHVRHNYATLLTQCDIQLGRLLDKMDELNMWEDTMLIVNTDHGHFLGEKDHFAKNYMPWWEEISHIPLFIWDPRLKVAGEKRDSLVQTIDLPATILEFFGHDIPKDMIGVPLRSVIENDTGGRDAGLFGSFGHFVNVTDGKHVYMRHSVNEDGGPLYSYDTFSTRYRMHLQRGNEMNIELVDPLPNSKGMKVLRLKIDPGVNHRKYGNLLYDVEADPLQENPLDDAALEAQMCELMKEQMAIAGAPPEQYERMGL